MATMYDTPMHDFSQDSTMDAEMLPSATSDADWLQVENMMEDGDALKPLPQEVDMTHDDVQELEMRDADAELGGDFGQVPSEHSRQLFRPEPQDQEIPDASRAPSPGPLAAIPLQIPAFPDSVGSDQGSDHALRQPNPEAEPAGDTTHVTQDSSTAHQSSEAKDDTTTHPASVTDEPIPLADVGNVSATDCQDNSTISDESTRSPQLRPQEEDQQEALELLEHAEEPVTLARDHEEDPNDIRPQGIEVTAETQATEADDDGLLIDPPPSVLLFYPFDNSHFALFTLPEISRPSDINANSALEEPSTPPDGETAHESGYRREIPEGHPNVSGPGHAGSDSPVLLFHERFALYYEPLSLVFAALRADSDFNVEGRFDENVELMISAPELDLNLPEDNIHSREVSLHDLGVLHNGCELSGPLSLRLDTVSPRFGTRYKAIRDEILRVVSQQEEQERQSLLVSGDEYLADSPLDTYSENHTRDGAPNQHKPEHEQSAVGVNSEDDRVESSEPRLDENQDVSHDTSDSCKGEELQDGDPSDNLPSEEYAVSHDNDQVEAEGEDAEERYAEDEGEPAFDADYDGQDALYDDVEHPEQQPNEVQSSRGEQEEYPSPLDDPDAPLDTAGEVFDVFDESVDVFDDGKLTVNVESTKHAGLSPGYDVAVDSSDVQESNSDAVSKQLPQSSRLSRGSIDIASHEYESYASALSVPSPTEEKSHSRSGTPRPSSDGGHRQDELIAYEDAVNEEEPLILPASSNRADSRAVSTTSKRSYDELADQLDGSDTLNGDLTESKRLRID